MNPGAARNRHEGLCRASRSMAVKTPARWTSQHSKIGTLVVLQSHKEWETRKRCKNERRVNKQFEAFTKCFSVGRIFTPKQVPLRATTWVTDGPVHQIVMFQLEIWIFADEFEIYVIHSMYRRSKKKKEKDFFAKFTYVWRINAFRIRATKQISIWKGSFCFGKNVSFVGFFP